MNALRPGQIGHIWATRKAVAWDSVGKATAWDDRQAYHYDMLGNTIAVTNRATGAVVARPAMEAYGTLVSTGGQPAATASGTQYWQTTKWRDPALGGLGYFNARWYDERTAQWSGKDPLGQFLNSYNWGAYSPTAAVDPDGRFFFLPPVAALVSMSPLFCAQREVNAFYASTTYSNGRHNNHDEFLHCTVSCIVAQRCGQAAAIYAGGLANTETIRTLTKTHWGTKLPISTAVA